MTVPEKLQIIQKSTGLTQTKLAGRFGVSFVTFNSWWTGKSKPRHKKQIAIDDFLLEVTGQKKIPFDHLAAKKQILTQKTKDRRSVISEILNNPDIRDAFLLKLTYNSNRIEGSTLTEPDTAAIIFDNVALPDKSLIEQLEAKNHQTALIFLFGHIASGGSLTDELILKLHSILMNGIRPDAGLYRRHAVRILGVNLPTANFLKVPGLMADLANDIKKQVKDVIALSANIHSRFEQIHPFSDGNGRVDRILMNAMLLKANFAPAVIRQEEKRLYYTYLYQAQDKGELSQLEDFICEAVMNGYKILERL